MYLKSHDAMLFGVRIIMKKALSLLALLLCLFVGTVKAEVAQVPLFLTSSVDPNIMFVIDDSGSMHWETMPDTTVTYKVGSSIGTLLMWLYPRVTGLHGGTDYSNTRIPRFSGNLAAFVRSSHNNTVYYNPAITYRPWVNADGTEMPDAPPSAAPNRPRFDGSVTGNPNFGTRNLEQVFSYDHWRNDNGTDGNDTVANIWPSLYYHYNGGDVDLETSYTRVEIRPANAPFTGHGRLNRTDCAVVDSCTYAEEIQNFANWYTYHRNRIFASRAGIGRAFAPFDGGMRVGFGAINYRRTATNNVTLDGLSARNRTILDGVRDFTGSNKDAFFTRLYDRGFPGDGTALRRGLDGAGQYFSRTDDQGPWSTTPGASGGENLVCRSSYSILMTDGFATGGTGWDADHANRQANTDGSTSQSTTNVHPLDITKNYSYSQHDPYQDSYSNTLADIAMYYWKRDLRPDLANRVPVTTRNPAFWQHMVTYGVGLGVQGSVDPAVAWQAVIDGTPIAWPDPAFSTANCGSVAGACEARIDDLLHASINSRGGFFSAAEPTVFAKELAKVLEDILDQTESSAAAIATNSTRLVDGSLIYQARFDSSDWSGELRAYPIALDGSVLYNETEWNTYQNSLTPVPSPIPSYPGWDTNETGKIPAHASRSIVTWNGSLGIPFTVAQWNNLNSTQQTALIDGDVDGSGDPDMTAGQNRLNWIRGEDVTGMRARSTVLSDIVNSDPLVVGVPNFRYELLPTGTPGKATYISYRQTVSRPRMLYVGANDGMLHAFDAATGVEKFAFVPAGVFADLAELTRTDYNHKFYVDGSQAVGDAFIPYTDYNGASQSANWRTIVVGSLGAGGRSIYALDVTDPDNFNHHNVLWEFSHPDLGYAFGQPQIVRLQNGVWAAVFGNGYLKREVDTDPDFTAQLFIVDLATGTLIKKIDTGVGSTGASLLNQFVGMSTPALLPDSQRTITAAYAGDLQGNLWKFDLSSSTPETDNHSGWTSAHVSGTALLPLFTARNDLNDTLVPPENKIQSITAPIEIGVPPTGQTGYMIYFGTGKYFEDGDNDVSSPPTNPGIQSFYGIWDNGSRIDVTDRSDANYPLVEQEIKREITVGVENDGTLTVNNIGSGPLAANETNYRIVSEEAVNYPGKRGWFLDLVSPVFGQQGERVVSSPLLRRGRIIFTTLIPMDDPCSTGGTSWLMELDATTGARLTKSVFDVNKDGSIDSGDFVTVVIDGTTYTIPVSGRQSKVGIIKTPAVIEAGELEYKYFGGSDGDIEVVTEAGGDPDDFGRRSWRQLQ